MRPIPIRTHLLLGDRNTWSDPALYEQPWNVGAIISVGGGDHQWELPVETRSEIEYLHLGIPDKGSVRLMSQAMVQAILFLRKQHDAGTTVLVHCQGGMSRSPAVICAYLMATEGCTWDEAVSDLRQWRKIRPRTEYERSATMAIEALLAENM